MKRLLLTVVARAARPVLGVVAAMLYGGGLAAAAPEVAPPPVAAMPPLSCGDAIRMALVKNPTLMALRQQHGIAAAGIVIARQYPFNPIWQSYVMGDQGPVGQVLNHVFNEQVFRLDLEIRGQGRYRKQIASAALSRTDWDVAFQETAMAVRTARAFHTVIYRQEKLKLIDDTGSFYTRSLGQLQKLAEQGKLRPADVMLARADLIDVRSQRGPAQTALDAAWQELRRSLGLIDEPFSIQGELSPTPPATEADTLKQKALDARADLRGRRMAINEAEGRLKLEIANRFGNPSFGPAYETNETAVNFAGVWSVMPIPLLNTRRGEILQRRAELDQAIFNVRQTEVLVQQDVQAALARLHDATAWVQNFRVDVLPTLQNMEESFDKLFAAGEPGVDVLRVIDVRRRLLRARDTYLDALWELSQAQADLAAALGDPSVGCCGAAEPPHACDNKAEGPADRVLPH